MINPRDIESMDTEQGRKELGDEFVDEFTNGKGDDQDANN